MYKIPVALDSNELHEVTLEQMFDPRVNKNFYDNTNKLNLTEYLRLIKLFYTKHNVLNEINSAFASFPLDTAAQRKLCRDLILNMPDDIVWVMAFLRNIQPYWVTDRTYSVTMSLYKMVLAGSGRNPMYCSHNGNYNVFSTPNAIGTETHDKNLYDFLRTEGEKIEANFKAMIDTSDKAYLHPDWYSNFTFTLGTLLKYTANRSIIDTGDETVTTTELKRMLESNPESTVRVSKTYYGITISISVPITKTYRDPLYRVQSYSQNVLELLPWPMTLAGEHNPLLFGVELELTSDYRPKDLIDAQDELFFILKQDSSVSGNRSFPYELVTVPMSFRAHKQQWARWFRKLDINKFDTSHQTSNGMHVHIARTAFEGERHIRNFTWFFHNPANYEFIFTLSERNQNSFNQYAGTYRFNYNSKKVSSFKQAERYANALRGAVTAGRKDKTVEVRLFRGVVSLAYITKNLECVEAIFDFTRECGYQDINIKGFLAWLAKQPHNRFRVFRKYLKGINFNSILPLQEIKDIIFSESRPDKIVSMLVKHKFRATERHVLALNRMVQSETFTLDPATGDVCLIGAPASVNLHSLNDSLSQRFAS